VSVRAKKRFGQNFLHDGNAIARIIDAINPRADDHFVEIGPGQGAISEPLCRRSKRLDVIEIDRDLAAELRQRDWPGEFQLHEADALRFDFSQLPAANDKLRLAGNLPYNISTPLLFHLLDSANLFEDIHVMLQKEVVDRMAAEPGSKQYGRLTVMLAARCEVIPLFDIKPGCFRPAPKVYSSFARLLPSAEPLVSDEMLPIYKAVVTQAFSMRRKTLSNALRKLMEPEDIEAAGIDPGLRAEVLTPEEFLALANMAVASAD